MFRTLAPFSPTFSSIECQSESVRSQFPLVTHLTMRLICLMAWDSVTLWCQWAVTSGARGDIQRLVTQDNGGLTSMKRSLKRVTVMLWSVSDQVISSLPMRKHREWTRWKMKSKTNLVCLCGSISGHWPPIYCLFLMKSICEYEG